MYLLDANVFIEAKNFYYSYDICPAFWTWLDDALGDTVVSIELVRQELAEGNDELADWAKAQKDPDRFLEVDDEPTQELFKQVAATVMAGDCQPHAKSEFLKGADPWLVAKAKVIGGTVVTQEQLNLAAKRKVFLPNICSAFAVDFQGTYKLLRNLGVQFT